MDRKRVLIVEDEGLIANDIACQLEKIGYAMEGIASSGEEALTLLEQSRPDVILMDIRLQGEMDGIDVAMTVRSRYKVPVIFLTSHADSETLSRAKLAEPFGYLVKPFRHVNLASAIEMALFKHQSEQALVEREAWLATVLHCAPAATIVTNVEGRVQFVNEAAEQMLGRSLGEIAGLPWTEAAPLFFREDGASADEFLRSAAPRLLRTKLPPGLLVRDADGNEVEIEGEIAPSISQEHIAGAVITLRDVSERHQEEAEHRQEEKTLAMGRLAGGVAHEFNNLLTVIIGHGEVVAAGTTSPGDHARIEALLQAARSAGEVTRQLMMLSGSLAARADLLNLNNNVRRLAQMLRPALGQQVRLQLELDAGTGRVRINAARFDQMLLNLLVNARDAMPNGGTLQVTTRAVERVVREGEVDRKRGYVLLQISDTGAGVAPAAVDHLFDPFFAARRAGEGTGLELSMVYGIVKEAGGEIAVRSAVGEGSCFEVRLPVEEPAAWEEERAPRAAAGGRHEESEGKLGVILLAENQPAIVLLMRTFLKQQGYTVIAASNGEEALELAAAYEGRIDLLVADVLMPLMDGATLARELSLTQPGMKTLLMSGDPRDALAQVRQCAPEAEFLQKPFGLPKLLDKVKELLASMESR